MKKIIFVTVCLLMASYLKTAAQNNVIDEIVWVVGDEAIYKSEVEEARREGLKNDVQWDGDPYCVIPEQLAVNKLFMNQAELDSIFVTDDDLSQSVESDLKAIIEECGSQEKMEERYEMSMDQIRSRIYENRRQAYVINEVRKKIMSKVKVTPAEVRRYIKDIPASDIPDIPNQVEVQIITLEPTVPQEEIDAVKADLRSYIDRVQSGEISFSTLARLYSEDPGSARNGGDLGFFGRGEMVPEFSTTAFNMTDPDKISKIIETEYGYHILQFVERLGDRVRVRHILRKPRIPMESVNNCLARLDTIANDIRSGNHTFEFCVAGYSQDKDTRNNNGLMNNSPDPTIPGTSKFRMEELPAQVAMVVDKMHVGEISDPFVMQLPNGKTICAIVKLKNKINAHKANMAEDYEILYEIVSSVRQQEALDKWIRDKQRTTYVRISDGWNDCDFKYPGWGKY
ncbi:MAG: peptidylprolyl isomerase [Bacteroidaceae bacterium]|nr:peptidylprolyl isomerase [Bacteroidaceae bacterium]MBR5159654.1 peptidylprolyl isomerase [Bacteroidaceae bacterium]